MLAEPFHYRDERTARGIAAVHAVVPPDELYAASGLQHLSFNTVFQLAADGEALAEADRLLLIPDLVAFWLTGRSVAESTNASTTALLDPHTGEWNDALIARVDLPRRLFPQLVRPGDDLGALTPAMAAELAAPAGARVTAVGSHDTASAVVGVPMTRPDAAYISCGTWGLVGLELEHPVITDASREANFTNEGGVDGRVRFLHNVMGLWLLTETMRAWEAESGPVDLGRLLVEAAAVTESVPTFDTNDQRFMPPGDMPSRIAAVLAEQGESLPTLRPAIARCILESLAAAFAGAVRTAGQLADREIGVIHIVGGGTQTAGGTAGASGKEIFDSLTTAATGASNANETIGNLQLAIEAVSTVRSEMGAAANRLNHVYNNLANVSTNTKNATGRIMDVDFATESSNMTAKQMLMQAGTAMLKQTNSMSSMVMSLLQ